MAVVVVLPCVPAIASRRRCEQSSASSSPRWITVWPRSRARASSGLSSGTAVETTTSASGGTWSASWPSCGLDAGSPEALHVGGLGAVGAAHLGAELLRDQRQPAHPGAADRDEVEPPPLHLSHAPRPSGPRARSARRRRAWPADAPRSTSTAAGPRRRAAPRSRRSAAAGVSSRSGITTAAPPSAIQRALVVWWSPVACG